MGVSHDWLAPRCECHACATKRLREGGWIPWDEIPSINRPLAFVLYGGNAKMTVTVTGKRTPPK
jgi:hypothetical protein